ncbi:hypothetical protein ES703_14524 [subsurface metagenome]
MNYRVASLLPSEAADSAATKTLDLNFAKPISRITVQIKALNNGNVVTAHPAKIISKIEVVDGSEILFSLSGIQIQALNYYDKGRMAHTVLNYIDEVRSIVTFDIDFGRYLFDPILALDPAKFTNPQLKITHDLSLGGSAPDAMLLSVFGHIFDQKEVAPTGFLMSKEQYSFTLNGTAKEQIELATDHPYRKLFMQSLSDTRQPFEQYNIIKLDEDNDHRVVINGEKTSDLIKLLQMWPRYTEQVMAYGVSTTTEVFPCSVSYEKAVSVNVVGADTTGYINDTYGPSVSFTPSASAIVLMIVNGVVPLNAFCIPFGDQQLPEDWYKMADVGSLRLAITGGSGSSDTCEIFSQQEMPY